MEICRIAEGMNKEWKSDNKEEDGIVLEELTEVPLKRNKW
jgi:hypothetical protein